MVVHWSGRNRNCTVCRLEMPMLRLLLYDVPKLQDFGAQRDSLTPLAGKSIVQVLNVA